LSLNCTLKWYSSTGWGRAPPWWDRAWKRDSGAMGNDPGIADPLLGANPCVGQNLLGMTANSWLIICTQIFYINVDMWSRLLISFCTVLNALGRSTEDMVEQYLFLWDFMFLQWRVWRWLSSGLLHHVVW
jgi:hypothetical protein